MGNLPAGPECTDVRLLSELTVHGKQEDLAAQGDLDYIRKIWKIIDADPGELR